MPFPCTILLTKYVYVPYTNRSTGDVTGLATNRDIFDRDKRTCVHCGKAGATTVDHVMPQCGGGRSWDNLAACHWRLVINTATTIVTFLLVALLQHSSHRADLVLERKVNAVAYGLVDLMEHVAQQSAKGACERLGADAQHLLEVRASEGEGDHVLNAHIPAAGGHVQAESASGGWVSSIGCGWLMSGGPVFRGPSSAEHEAADGEGHLRPGPAARVHARTDGWGVPAV